MVKHTQTIRIDLSVFDHIMGLVLKGLKTYSFTCVIAYITKISTPPPPLENCHPKLLLITNCHRKIHSMLSYLMLTYSIFQELLTQT